MFDKLFYSDNLFILLRMPHMCADKHVDHDAPDAPNIALKRMRPPHHDFGGQEPVTFIGPHGLTWGAAREIKIFVFGLRVVHYLFQIRLHRQ